MTPRPLERAQALLYEMNRPEMAERELRRVLAEDPDDPIAHALLAQALGMQNDLAGAEREMREAIRLAPDSTAGHRVRGWLRERCDRLPEAERAYREVLRINPADPNGYPALSNVLLKQDRATEALAVADQGLERHAEDVRCLICRAQALLRLERTDEAATAIELALRLDPSEPATHALRGLIASRTSKPKPALESFLTSLEREPDDAWTRQRLHESLMPIAEGWAIFMLLLATTCGAFAFFVQNDDWLRRLLLGTTAAFIVPACLGLMHEPFKRGILRFSRWGQYAGLASELDFGRRLVLGALVLGLVNAIQWAFWPDWKMALSGTIVAFAIAVPLLILSPELSRQENRRIALRGAIILVPCAIGSVISISLGRVQGAAIFAVGALLIGAMLRVEEAKRRTR